MSQPEPPTTDAQWLLQVVASCLKVQSSDIDRQVALARYGLDSFAAIKLTTAISARLERQVPETLLLNYPSVAALAAYMQAPEASEASPCRFTGDASVMAGMLADSLLPADILPRTGPCTVGRQTSILMTGATGFLGAYLLRALLRDTRADVYCLVRDADERAIDRLRGNLLRYDIWDTAFESRVHAVAGDLRLPHVGLSPSKFDFLARHIDEIYHCGANVNWALPYAGLRDVNVAGTVELLRLACFGIPKPFRFISSIATCYTSSPLQHLSESDETLRFLQGIHLGYAQSKCVAESLVRRASERGLPTTIFRPALITGDSTTGLSNSDDLLSTMIRGCIAMRSAPNLEWSLDCCAVDYVADTLVGLCRSPTSPLNVVHLVNPVRRRWPEIVLWLNLWGYPIRLESYRNWLAELRTAAAQPTHPLYRLRGFFLGRPVAGGGELTLPELFEDHRRSVVNSEVSQHRLSQLCTSCPDLDSKLMAGYLKAYIENGILPEAPDRRPVTIGQPPVLGSRFFEGLLQRHYKDDSLRVQSIEYQRVNALESITSELTSWHSASPCGLSGLRLGIKGRTGERSLKLFVKVKPTSDEVLRVAKCVALACDEAVGRSIARHAERLEIVDCHLREIEIYRQSDSRFRNHVPLVYASIDDAPNGRWILALESLCDCELVDSANDIRGWQRQHIAAAIEGMAQLHSVWYQRVPELVAERMHVRQRTAAETRELIDLWCTLAEYSWRFFSNWIDAPVQRSIHHWLNDVSDWRRVLDQMPQTLIHNDFNPRNLVFRNQSGKLRLCLYDWELATVDVPQYDLAELLCFVLTPDASRELVTEYVDLHRTQLAKATGCSIDAATWRVGFQLSLRYLIINRFAMYSLMHNFRPQAFLPRVIRTWRRLNSMFEPGSNF